MLNIFILPEKNNGFTNSYVLKLLFSYGVFQQCAPRFFSAGCYPGFYFLLTSI